MADRKIAGTNQTYSGTVVKLGEFEYTTIGGGIEGNRQQLEPLDTNTDTDISPNNDNNTNNNNTNNSKNETYTGSLTTGSDAYFDREAYSS